jgi:hypothetical protein
MVRSRAWGLLLVLIVAPSLLQAQAPRQYNVSFQMIEFETGSNSKMAAYGLLTGAAGFLIGGLVGAALIGDADDADSWVDALQGAVVGGTVGESLMLPIGVHLANGRRGDLLLSMPASLAIGAGGAWVGRRLERTGRIWPVLILTPVAQLAAAIAIERNTAN